MLSFAFSLRFSFVTSSTAVAPAGITAPLEPVTASFNVAENRSPTLFVFVQIFDADASVSAVPDAIEPTLPPEVFSPVVTVLPDGVRGGVVGAGVGAGVLGRVAGREGRGRDVVGAGAGSAAGVAGTSFSCGCAALSPVASWRSRLSAESCAREVSALLSPLLHAATPSANVSASGVMRRIYFDIVWPPNCVAVIRTRCAEKSAFSQGQAGKRYANHEGA